MPTVTFDYIPGDVVWVVDPKSVRVFKASVISVDINVFSQVNINDAISGSVSSPYQITPTPTTTNIPQTTPNVTGTTSAPTTTFTPIVTTTAAPTTSLPPSSSPPQVTTTLPPPSTLSPPEIVDIVQQTRIQYIVRAQILRDMVPVRFAMQASSEHVFGNEMDAIVYASNALQPA